MSVPRRGPFGMMPGLLALGLALALACSGPSPEQPAPTPPSGLAPETSMLPRGLVAETNMMATPVPAPASLMLNADFSDWTGAVPTEWELSPTSGTLLKKTDRKQDGSPVVEVIAEKKQGASLSQKVIEAGSLKPGQTLFATVWLRVLGKADLALIRVGTGPAGEEVREETSTPHPGDGSWHKVEAIWKAPAQLMPGLKEIEFQVRIQNAGTLEVAAPQVMQEFGP